MPPKPQPVREAPIPASHPDDRLGRLEADLYRLAQQVAVLDATLRLRDPILLRRGATDPALQAAIARVEAQDHLDPDSGFYNLEYATDGSAVRWTGPGRESRFVMFVSRDGPVKVTLGVHDFGGMAPADIRIKVDGTSMPLGEAQEGRWVAGPWLPRSAIEPSSIVIIVPTTAARRDANGAERPAGIALTYLEIGPA